jgi:hypothetical protein
MKKVLYFWMLGAVALAGCSDTSEVALRGGVAVSFATQSPTAGTPAPSFGRAPALDDTLVTGTDTLILTSVEVVLREIELKQAETADCDTEPEPAGCEEVEVGPVLVDLPLAPGADSTFAIEAPAGTYSRIDFEVHKVSSGDPEDAAFLQAHPTFADLSIRAQGTYNGTPFTFETDLDVDQELSLSPPMVVDESTATNVTVRVDVSTWFRSATGALIDPATANKGGLNESEVTENIKDSFKAFEDEDRDGDELDEG